MLLAAALVASACSDDAAPDDDTAEPTTTTPTSAAPADSTTIGAAPVDAEPADVPEPVTLRRAVTLADSPNYPGVDVDDLQLPTCGVLLEATVASVAAEALDCFDDARAAGERVALVQRTAVGVEAWIVHPDGYLERHTSGAPVWQALFCTGSDVMRRTSDVDTLPPLYLDVEGECVVDPADLRWQLGVDLPETVEPGDTFLLELPSTYPGDVGRGVRMVQDVGWEKRPIWAWVGAVEVADDGSHVATVTMPDHGWQHVQLEFTQTRRVPLPAGIYRFELTEGGPLIGERTLFERTELRTYAAGAGPSATLGEPILEPDGLAGVPFGTPTDEAIERLTAIFGAPTSDEISECSLERIVTWDHLWIGVDETFDSYTYGDLADPTNAPYRTPGGIGIGTPAVDLIGYVEIWAWSQGEPGATIWLDDFNRGGFFTGDASDPTSTVRSIGASADGSTVFDFC